MTLRQFMWEIEMKALFAAARHALVSATTNACALAVGLAIAVSALSTAPATAQTVVLPANEEWYELFQYDLGNSPGGWTYTFTSSRELTYISAYTYEEVDYHLHADSGDGGARERYWQGNMKFINTWSHGFTIRYSDSLSSITDGCCWPDTNTGEWVGYHEETFYNTFLYVDVGFAPGSDPITLQIGGGSVPEPATWAMLVVGFGAVGTLARAARRRNALNAA